MRSVAPPNFGPRLPGAISVRGRIMRTRSRFLLALVVLCVCLSMLLPATARAQTAAGAAAVSPPSLPSQITQAIDPNNLVVLRGNTHPLAQSQYDQGAVPDATPLHRMLLLLQRSPQQEQVLRQFLDQQQSKSSPNFHAWLTPEQFGAQYGPASADVQTVSSWLTAQGFKVNRVSAGRTIIEFDGTAGQVRNTFHTQIHRYMLNGEEHTANSSDPQIPAALTPLVAGIVSLHNFPATSHLLKLGGFKRSRETGTVEPLPGPLYTPPNTSQQYPLVPGDFAIIYKVAPLWKAGIDGTGQTIAIVGATDINVADIQNFRALFGLPNNFTSANVILDGIDPGINGNETEADLDVEWSGAVAKNATIDLVVSAATEVTGGTHLSALYIVDHNLAGVLSESYGECEAALGAANNQYYNSLWEQAAAQGITVVLSAGDGGSAGCDDFNSQATATRGLAVSGYASTPFNVAVGGTDFDQMSKWTQYWNSTNAADYSSALGYIPEVPWNDSCAQLGLGGCGSSQPGGDFLNIVAGSGGASTIYSKPSWQSGTGVPPDKKRDIPDVSLMASNGFTGTGYLVCESDYNFANCQVDGGSFNFLGVGGTSASAPSFAGIMALINQSQAQQNLSNRQGNANYVLYALAKQQANTTPALNCNASANPVAACTFNDVTSGNSFYTTSGVGNNSVPCTGGPPNCSSKVAGTNGILVTPAVNTSPATPAYTTNTGYDLATGLGSVNAQNLAANWKSANSVATTTALSLNSGQAVSITHGAPVNVSVTVTPKTAAGDVSLVATFPPSGSSPNGSTLGMAQFTLAGGMASGMTSNLAGGTYNVTAHYEGDGTNAPSDSPSIPVTVAAEASKIFFTVPTFDPNTGRELSNQPTTLVYGSPYLLRADVTNSTGSLTQLCYNTNVLSCPSGTVAITDSVNGAPPQPVDAGTFALNSAGYTEDQLVQLMGGAHMLVAQYSGDNSYTKSTSSTYPLTVTPAPSNSIFNPNSFTVTVGQQFTLGDQILTQVYNSAAPGGTVTFVDGTTPLPGTPMLQSTAGNSYSFALLSADLNVTLSTGGVHSITAKYSGDANYGPSSAVVTVTALYPTTASLTSAAQANILYGTPVTLTATINTNVKSPVVTGSLTFYSSYSGYLSDPVLQTTGTDANGNTQITAVITTTPQSSTTIYANYPGDSNFAYSASPGLSFSVTTPDFTLATPPAIMIPAGQTGMATLAITPLSNLSSTVMLSCGGGLPLGSTCSIPASINLANGAAGSATVSVTSIAPSQATAAMVVPAQKKSFFAWFKGRPNNFFAPRLSPRLPHWWSASLAAGILAVVLLFVAFAERRSRLVWRAAAAAAIFCVVSFALGCGGGGSGIIIQPPPPQKAVTTTSVSSTVTKGPPGTPTTLTATVKSSNTVTGTVMFTVGPQTLAPVALVNGSAQMPTTLNNVGATAITAQYSGDSLNQPSTSANFYVVTTGSTSFTVTAQTGVNFHQVNGTVVIQ